MDEYLITKSDLELIISNAKRKMQHFSLPIYISDKEVDAREIPSLAILEGVIMFLNNRKFLTNAISVNYTDACSLHDPESPLEPEEK